MKRTFAEIAAAIAAGAITYVIFEYAKAFTLAVRIVVAVVVAVVCIVVAWRLRRRGDHAEGAEVSVGDRIKARDDISVDDVEVSNPEGDTRVGTRLRSGKAVRISGVKIDGKKDAE